MIAITATRKVLDAMERTGQWVFPARRKRLGSGWCISRAHWPAALSSEQSCGSPYKGSPRESADVRSWRAQAFARVANRRIRDCTSLPHSSRMLPIPGFGGAGGR